MKVVIVGGSSAGLYAALLLKRKHPDFEVLVIDKNEQVGRKLCATGNGHCNLLREQIDPKDFRHPSSVERLLRKYPIDQLKEILFSFGVTLKNIDGLYYPNSFSAPAHVRHLQGLCERLGVEFRLKEKVLSYGKNEVKTNHGAIVCDKIIFASGGKSQDNLGSDGSLFAEFAGHGYAVKTPIPGLCPVKVKEDVRCLKGLRHDAKVTVTSKGRPLFKEDGEVLFKQDGLSGIVVFNASRYLANEGGAKIIIDLFPDLSYDNLRATLCKLNDLDAGHFADGLLVPPLAEYLRKRLKQEGKAWNPAELAQICKHLEFTYKGLYPFDSSQVTVGGISLDDVNEDFSSVREPNVFFIGEVLDNDGPCGGYNLTWCLWTALAVAEAL